MGNYEMPAHIRGGGAIVHGGLMGILHRYSSAFNSIFKKLFLETGTGDPSSTVISSDLHVIL